MPLTINGEPVDDALLDAEFSQIKAHHEQQANVSCCERDDEFMGYAKDNIIARVLLNQNAKEEAAPPSESEIDDLPRGAEGGIRRRRAVLFPTRDRPGRRGRGA